jgi:hypothetical protein
MKWILMAGLAAVISSCGENSTSSESTADTTTVTAPTTTTTYATVDVPPPVRTTFETSYPSATNIEWKRYNSEPVEMVDWDLTGWPTLDTNDYVVMFDWDGYDYYAWYDDQGNWIGATYEIPDHSKLPAAVNAAIKKDYAGYTIVEVDKEVDKRRTAYEVELQKDADRVKILYAEDGSVLKKKAAGEKVKPA